MSIDPEMAAGLTGRIIGAAIEVHRHLGPGLLESVYRDCLGRELLLRAIPFEREVPFPVAYKGCDLGHTYRVDLLVERRVIVELKAAERLLPIHQAQVLTQLKLTSIAIGLLINFNVPVLSQGLKRIVCGPGVDLKAGLTADGPASRRPQPLGNCGPRRHRGDEVTE